jgi:hypothetical protein
LQENEHNAADVQQRHAAYLTARQAFEKMDGSAAAADAQQQTAQHAARISELGADYAASRIASAVLAQVIDTYQKRNQGPLIDKASKRFAAITAGRYTGVVVDYDEDKQILKATRADGERLSMEQLSTGRRDQLFLALRLAAIEGHLDNGEPLPVIVDDITIQFDDEAAAATFKVLADLSQRTQVLFLTHHEHLLDVAEAAIGAGTYQSHRQIEGDRRPCFRPITRSASSGSSAGLCTTVISVAWCAALTSRWQTSAAADGSSAAVGSSARIRRGRCISRRAMATFCRSPPESLSARVWARGSKPTACSAASAWATSAPENSAPSCASR